MINPARGCVIVRPVSTEETQGNGKVVLLESSREKLASCQMLVVSVGADELCPEPDECDHDDYFDVATSDYYHPTDKRIKPDAWVLIRPRSLVEISAADKLYSVKISDVAGVFVGEAV